MGPAFDAKWIEVVCEDCMQDILAHGWGPRHQPLLQGKTSCTECAINLGRLGREARGEGFRVVQWSLTVPEGGSDWRLAQHEAAHAVLSERNGLIVTNAQIASSIVDVGGVERELNGHVHFESPEGGAPPANVANALHAGWAVDRLWLKSLGLGTDLPAQLDVAVSSAADMVAVDFGDPAVHVQAMRDADAQVLEYHDEITAVQKELLRSTHIDGDAVRHAMQQVHEADKARAIAKRTTPHPPSPAEDKTTGTAQIPAAVAGETSTPRTTTTGGTGMSLIDQARESLGQADEKATYIRGALAQAVLDAESNVALLSQVSQESQSATEIAHTYQQVIEQVQQALQLVQHATDLTEGYALSLHS